MVLNGLLGFIGVMSRVLTMADPGGAFFKPYLGVEGGVSVGTQFGS